MVGGLPSYLQTGGFGKWWFVPVLNRAGGLVVGWFPMYLQKVGLEIGGLVVGWFTPFILYKNQGFKAPVPPIHQFRVPRPYASPTKHIGDQKLSTSEKKLTYWFEQMMFPLEGEIPGVSMILILGHDPHF